LSWEIYTETQKITLWSMLI